MSIGTVESLWGKGHLSCVRSSSLPTPLPPPENASHFPFLFFIHFIATSLTDFHNLPREEDCLLLGNTKST